MEEEATREVSQERRRGGEEEVKDAAQLDAEWAFRLRIIEMFLAEILIITFICWVSLSRSLSPSLPLSPSLSLSLAFRKNGLTTIYEFQISCLPKIWASHAHIQEHFVVLLRLHLRRASSCPPATPLCQTLDWAELSAFSQFEYFNINEKCSGQSFFGCCYQFAAFANEN